MSESKALAALQAENARLTALLAMHGIEWRQSGSSALAIREPESSSLSIAEKVTSLPILLQVAWASGSLCSANTRSFVPR